MADQPKREAEAARKTPTYVDGRAATPADGAPPARATMMGGAGGEAAPLAPGVTPPIASPSSPPRATPGGSPMVSGVLETRSPTPGGSAAVPRSSTPTSLVTAPPPRTATPSGSHVTLMGTPTIPPRHPTPGAGAAPAARSVSPTQSPAERSLSPAQQHIPEELTQRATGSSRTRIGLPSVLPSMFRKRDTGLDGPPPSAPHSSTDPAATMPRGGRETVLLSKVKRPGQSTPGTGSPAVALARRESADSGRRSGGSKVRPAVAPADMHPIKQAVSPDPSRLVVLDQKRIPQGAAIRSLRHRLADKGDPRVILISSAGPQEGKTFCAANLALALAEIRRSRVLLLEANVHHPGLAELFGVRKPQSFFGQLEQHRMNIAAPWNVTELSTHDLHLLAIDPAAAEHGHAPSLDGALFATCMDSLRGAYEYIIVDGPPVSAGPDVSLLEDAVDGIVFVARSDQSHASSLRNALDQISPQDLLGVVLLEV